MKRCKTGPTPPSQVSTQAKGLGWDLEASDPVVFLIVHCLLYIFFLFYCCCQLFFCCFNVVFLFYCCCCQLLLLLPGFANFWCFTIFPCDFGPFRNGFHILLSRFSIKSRKLLQKVVPKIRGFLLNPKVGLWLTLIYQSIVFIFYMPTH